MKLTKKLISKYKLNKEDIDDIESEIALSFAEYGYQRKLEHIVIDFLEKFNHFRRDAKTNKRVCKMRTVEYTETSDESEANRSTPFGYGELQSSIYLHDKTVSGAGVEYSMNELLRIVDKMPKRKREIVIMFFIEGHTLKQVGNWLGITESRVSQILADTLDRLSLISACKNFKNIVGVVKW